MLQSTVLLFLLLSTADSTFLADCSAEGGKIIDSNCFIIQRTAEDYSTGKTACTKIKNAYGHLAFIRSLEQISAMVASGLIASPVIGAYKYKVGIEKVNGVWSYVDGSGFVQGKANLSIFSDETPTATTADFFPYYNPTPIFAQDNILWTLCEYEQHSYDSCVANSTATEVLYDWCFQWFEKPSSGFLTPAEAEAMCQPNGHLAALVTKEMFDAVSRIMTGGTFSKAWIGLQQDLTATTKFEQWYWKILRKDNSYNTQLIDNTQVKWFPGEPSDGGPTENGTENYAYLNKNNGGLTDVSPTNANTRAVICQFKGPWRKFVLYKKSGYYSVPAFLVGQMLKPNRRQCLITCAQSEFCLSFAYKSATKDCQHYAITPNDAAAASKLINDVSYELFYRAGIQ